MEGFLGAEVRIEIKKQILQLHRLQKLKCSTRWTGKNMIIPTSTYYSILGLVEVPEFVDYLAQKHGSDFKIFSSDPETPEVSLRVIIGDKPDEIHHGFYGLFVLIINRTRTTDFHFKKNGYDADGKGPLIFKQVVRRLIDEFQTWFLTNH